MRSVLVCVRTPLSGTRGVECRCPNLGSATSSPPRSAERTRLARWRDAADVLLVDTASVRPDTVAFTRRVLREIYRTPCLFFFGPEDSTVLVGRSKRGSWLDSRRRARGSCGVCREGVNVIIRGRYRFNGGPNPAVPQQRSEVDDPGDETAQNDKPHGR